MLTNNQIMKTRNKKTDSKTENNPYHSAFDKNRW